MSAAPHPICLDAAVPDVTPRAVAGQLPRLRAGTLQAVLATVAALEPPAEAVRAVGAWWQVDRDPAIGARVATSVADVRRIAADGELAVVLHFQGAEPLGGSLDMLDAYHRLGVRVMQLTYNAASTLGDGCLEERGGGLTKLGRQALERMHELGIAPDVSHAGERTCLDALELARRPVLATHANARAVCDSPRNLRDAVIDRIAATGGVIGLCAFAAFVATGRTPTIDDLIDHAVHIAGRVGIEHVGLGLDFADEDEADYDYYGYDPRWYPRPPWVWPTGIAWFDEVGNLRGRLAQRGFSDAEIAGVMGENFLRVLDELWTPAPVGAKAA
jgi:membrane dipeptidase